MEILKRYNMMFLKMMKNSVSGIREFACFFLLSIMIICLFKGKVNSFVIDLLPEDKVIITVKDTESSFKRGARIRIIKEGNKYELFSQCKKAAKKEMWKYEKREESWTSITNITSGSDLSFRAKRLPNTYIAIRNNENGGTVSVRGGGYNQVVDISDESNDVVRIYPFEESFLKIVLQFLAYGVLFLIILTILLTVNYFFKNREICLPDWLKREVRMYDMVWIWISLYLLALVMYKAVGIPRYLEFGDQQFYWETLLLHNGKFDMQYLVDNLFAPRGYWCHVFQTIAICMGAAFHIDSIIIWLLFPTFFIAVFAVILFPGYLKCLCDKSAKVVESIAFLIVFVYYWLGYLTGVLMDIFGVVTLFSAFLCILLFIKERKIKWAVLAGGFSAMTASFRIANVYGVYVFVVIAAVFQIWRNRKKLLGSASSKQFVTGLLAGTFTFLIVCVPQFAINYEKGHFGFLPYDFETAWMGRSLIEASADNSLSYGEMASPMGGITDNQMVTMKSALYITEEPLKIAQILDVFAESPLETFMMMFKKLLIGFDVQTNVLYPVDDKVNWRGSYGMIFSFINYFVIFTGLYFLFSGRIVSKKERQMAWLIFLTILLPETFGHMEWRYVIAGYVFLYYIFAYHFIGDVVLDKNEYKKIIEDSNYLPFIIITIFIMFCFSFSSIAFRFA